MIEPVIDDSVVMPNVLRRWARTEPDRPFLHEVTGRTATYGELYELALRWVAGLRAVGVQPGDRVLTMQLPRIEWFAVWTGLSLLKAVDAGVSTDFHGDMLRYVLAKAEAELIIVEPEFVDRLTPEVVTGSRLRTVIVTGRCEPVPGLATVFVDDFLPAPADASGIAPVELRDTAAMILTSGTTGPSKYVITPWGTLYTGAGAMVPPSDARPDDVSYQPLPVYHLAARFSIYAMVLVGGQVVLRDHLSISEFWTDVARYRATVTNVSPFARLLLAAPARDDDADNTLRTVMLAPRAPAKVFGERFGVNVCTGFGMSETGVPIVAGFDANLATSGKPRSGWPGFEMRVVDGDDYEVPVGEVGELIVRSSQPWALMQGYYGDPAATAKAWRNGWLHTGDAFRCDDEGYLYFVDRLKDSLRRRNQNISSFEVEASVNGHPEVAESAAVGVPVPDEEDELLVVVVPCDPGSPPAPEELYGYFREKLPRFMLPRYIRFLPELPKTPATGRVQKVLLRTAGVTGDTWDREAAGMPR